MFSSVWCCFTDIVVPFLSEGTISFFTSNATDHLFGKYAKFSEKLTFLIPWYAHVRRIKFKHTFEVGLFGIMIDEKWNCSTHWKCLSSLRCWPAWIIHRRSRPEVFCEKNCPYKFRKISKSFKNAVFNRTPPVIVFF